MIFDKKIKALIFDCDGTLVDSGKIHLKAWKETIDGFGCIYDESFLILRNGLPSERIISDYNKHFGVDINAADFAQKKNKNMEQFLKQVKTIPEISSILLENFQKYKICVLSGGNAVDVTMSLKVNNLLDKCDLIVTADDGFPTKDNPEIYHQVAQSLSTSIDCCHFFEDGFFAIKAAKAAGMQVTDVNEFLSGIVK
ncbi:MAG: HAD superfamily hydrolase (TIGR01509 family) [Francisellaceae bacterium]|jgi:HAD superfamily hydrolase (TIGR01509 family)